MEFEGSTSKGERIDSSVHLAAMPGEAYLDLWGRSLQQYRRMSDVFFRPYSNGPRQPDEKKDGR